LLLKPLVDRLPSLDTSVGEGIQIMGRRAVEISTVSSTLDIDDGHAFGLRSIRDKTKSVPWVNRTVEEDDLVRTDITTTIIAVGIINRDCRAALWNAVDIIAHTKEVVEVDELAERNIRALDSLIITIFNTGLIHPRTTRGARSSGVSVLELSNLVIIRRISALLTHAVKILADELGIGIISITSGADDGAHLVDVPSAAKSVVISRVLDDASNRVRKSLNEGGHIKLADGSTAGLEISENLGQVGLKKRLDLPVGLSETSSASGANRLGDNLEVFREVKLGENRGRAGISNVNKIRILLTHPSRETATVGTTEGHNLAVSSLELFLDEVNENSVISKSLVSTQKTEILGAKSTIARDTLTIETMLDRDHESTILLSLLIKNEVTSKFNIAKRTLTTKHNKDGRTIATPEGLIHNITLFPSSNIVLAKMIIPLIKPLENIRINLTLHIRFKVEVTTCITNS